MVITRARRTRGEYKITFVKRTPLYTDLLYQSDVRAEINYIPFDRYGFLVFNYITVNLTIFKFVDEIIIGVGPRQSRLI